MTRKDYEAIAEAIKQAARLPHYRNEPEDIRRAIAENIAITMADDNPAFDRARFLKACGVQS